MGLSLALAAAMLATGVGVAVLGNEPEAVAAADGNVVNVTLNKTSGTVGDISWESGKGSGNNAPGVFSDNRLRVYPGNTVTVTSAKAKIESITITDPYKSDENVWTKFLVSSGTWDSSSYTVSGVDAESITFTNNNIRSKGNLRIGGLTITLAASNVTATEVTALGPETTLYTAEALNEEDFLVEVTKSDDSATTKDDYTVSIGAGTGEEYVKRADVTFGKTMPEIGDNNIRFTSVYPTADDPNNFPYCDVAITVSEPAIESIAIEGDMARKAYGKSDTEWDFSGLTVKGQPGDVDLTSSVDWSADPAAPTVGVTQIEVTTTYQDITATKTITGIEVANTVEDVLTYDFLDLSTSGSGYTDWTVVGASGAQYSGKTYRQSDLTYLQLRSKDGSGIVSTNSPGLIKSVALDWNSKTAAGREVDIYASNEAFANSDGLYNSTGTKVGSLAKGETTYTFTDSYKFVGIRSSSDTLYLNSVSFTWEVVDRTLTSIELLGNMEKTDYTDNEAWDPTGLSVQATYSDDSQQILTTGYELVYDPATPAVGVGSVNVKATYEGLETAVRSFDVTVEKYVEPYSLVADKDDEYVDTNTMSGAFTHEGLDWSYFVTADDPDGDVSSFDSDKGYHFGTGPHPSDKVIFFSEAFRKSTGETLIQEVEVNASSASDNDGDVELIVRVNGQEIGSTMISKTATDYTFPLSTPAYGSVEVELVNGGEKAAMYLKSIKVLASEDEVGSAIVPIIQELETIKTCEVSVGHEDFGLFYEVYKEDVTTHQDLLSTILIRDYASGDTDYSDPRTSTVDFMTKWEACLDRYLGEETTFAGLFGSDKASEDIITSIIVLGGLTLATGLLGLVYIHRRRRA